MRMYHKLIALGLAVLSSIGATVTMAQDKGINTTQSIGFKDHWEDNCLDFYSVEYKYISNKKGIAKIWDDITSKCKDYDIATKLDIGVSLSTFGIGIEAQTPVTRWTNLRIGLDWLPSITVPMSFNLTTYADGMPTGNFQHVKEMVYDMTGIEMHERVKMKGTASMVNFKFMVDVLPFQNDRRWHITAGFFAGSSMVGKAINDRAEKTTLVGLNLYNRGYEYFTNLKNIYDVPLGGGNYMDPKVVEELQEKFRRYGILGIHFGDFKNGKPYMLYPSPDGSVSAKAFVNHFKPYLGAGFTTPIDKAGKWNFSVDIGAIFWGGVPNIITHDWSTGQDISFTHDLINIKGKAGDYMKTIKSFPVYPYVGVKFSYSIF